jgi:hypothetical protein
MKLLRLSTIALGLVLAVPALAQAQDKAAPPPGKRAKVIRLGEFRIEGTIQKPQAFYILQRSNLNFEGLELKNSFVPKIVKSVEQAPF